jgi:hypothetical protein
MRLSGKKPDDGGESPAWLRAALPFGLAQAVDLPLRDQDFMARPHLVIADLSVQRPAPDRAPMPPQPGRRLLDGVVTLRVCAHRLRRAGRDHSVQGY